jgi:hypothetical protein
MSGFRTGSTNSTPHRANGTAEPPWTPTETQNTAIPSPPPLRPSGPSKTPRSVDLSRGRRGEQGDPPSGRPAWMTYLMRTTGLLIYEERGLTPAASKNLTAAAVFLIILWMFDAAAWALLVNMLLTGQLYQFSLGSIPAIVVGIAAATGILFYESSFITADLKHAAMPGVAVAIRLSVVLLFAVITSVPLDMYLLDSQINRRLHEEQVLLQLPPLVQAWQSAQERMKGNAVTKTAEDQQLVKPRSAVKVANDKVDAAREERDRAWATESRLQRLVNSLPYSLSKPGLDADARTRITQELAFDKAALAQATKVTAQKDAAFQQAKREQSSASLNVEQAGADFTATTTKEASEDAERYENWMQDLWNARPRTSVQERHPKDGNVLTYDGAIIEGSMGFGERVIAMYDVLAGRPPRRPNMSSGDQASLQQMKLSEFVKDDQVAMDRARTDAASLRLISLSCATVFTFFPLLILALKLLFDNDTKRYFDSEYQRSLPGESGGPTGPNVTVPPKIIAEA